MTAAQFSWRPLPSTRQRIEEGRARRLQLVRADLGRLTTKDREPLDILERQNRNRIPELVGLRNERMGVSPFTFYRGTAAIMAADLANDSHTGIRVASCGDAHVSNFGFYATQQRKLVFDLNDFDEAAWAPFEWDLKRLVTSVVIAGQASSRDDAVVRNAARDTVLTYARALRNGLSVSPVERYFMHADVEAARTAMGKQPRKVLEAAIRQARKRTGERAARRLTEVGEDGRRRFVENPPAMAHVAPEVVGGVHDYVERYVRSASVDIRMLMQKYQVSDVVRRVVGVGSVGTRCYLIVFSDGDGNSLVLQSKEANRSVLEEYGRLTQPAVVRDHVVEHGQGGRVVAMQRILQAMSDPFLGHFRSEFGVDLYVRQFHDMKGSFEMEALDDMPFSMVAQACAGLLARAHGQSPAAAVASGYLGKGGIAADPLVEWAYAYADLSRKDFAEFKRATG